MHYPDVFFMLFRQRKEKNSPMISKKVPEVLQKTSGTFFQNTLMRCFFQYSATGTAPVIIALKAYIYRIIRVLNQTSCSEISFFETTEQLPLKIRCLRPEFSIKHQNLQNVHPYKNKPSLTSEPLQTRSDIREGKLWMHRHNVRFADPILLIQFLDLLDQLLTAQV